MWWWKRQRFEKVILLYFHFVSFQCNVKWKKTTYKIQTRRTTWFSPIFSISEIVQMQRVVRWPALSSPWRWRPPPPPPYTPTWPPPTLPTSRPPPARPPPTSLSCQSRASLSHPTTILISAGKYWHQNLPSRLSVSSSKIFEGDVLFSDLNLIFLFLLEGIAHFEMELKSDATKLENNSKKVFQSFQQ